MKINKIIFVLSLCTMLWSCDNAIDIEQPGELSPADAFTNVGDLDSGLQGLYDIFDLSPVIQFNAVFTDEVAIGADSGGQGIGNGEYLFQLNAASAAPTQNWLLYHAALNSANVLLEAASIITPEAGEEDELNNIIGEIHALRAYAHFQVISYFSTDYADDSALGGILLDFIPDFTDQLPRSTNGEIFGLIDNDLTQASALLSDESSATTVSLDFVTALRARMAAYREQYTEADTFASELLAKYNLPEREDYVNVFLDESDEGIIFKLKRVLGDSHDRQATTGSGFGAGWVGANFAFTDGTIDGSPYFEMGRSLFAELDTLDVRYDVLLNETSIVNNGADVRDTLVIGKYPGNGINLMNDLKVFRVEEMLLIKAEAQADAGNINGAAGSTAALIKELRDIRFGTDQALPVYLNQEEAFGDILDERRIEFAYEGHRWKDLKRLGVRGNRILLRADEDCEDRDVCSLLSTDFRFTMPIPIVELNGNSIISEQQNPGY